MKLQKNVIIFVSAAITALIFISYFFINSEPVKRFAIIDISASAVFLLFCYVLIKYSISAKKILILIGIGIAVRLIFVNILPIGSDDVYRYMWDGKVQSNGINPYLFTPDSPQLAKLTSDILPAKVNYPDMKTIYFPLSQWMFYICFQISGESIWAYKLLILLYELLTFYSIFLLLKKLNIDPKFILFYVLCPLPIIQFAIDSHLDAFGLPLLLLSFYFYFDRKIIISAVFLGLSLSIKPVGLVIIPIFFLNEKRLIDRLKVSVIPFLVFFVEFLPYIFSTNPFDAFFIYTKNWYFNGLIFNTLNSLFHNNQTSRLICAIILIITLIPIYFNRMKTEEKIYYSVLLLFIFSPVVHPWYLAWILILIPVVRRWSGILFVTLSSLTVFTILTYKLDGIWKDYWPVLFVEYLPVFGFLIWELFFLNKTKKREINPA